MPMFQQDLEGVWIRTAKDHYRLTNEEFADALGMAVPPMGENITERIYVPGVVHSLKIDHDVVDGGPRTWPAADNWFTHIDGIMSKRVAEAKAKADAEAEAKRQAELAAETARRDQSLEEIERQQLWKVGPNAPIRRP